MPTIASHLPLNIWETVRYRSMVTKDHQYEIAYGESNCHMTDDPERSNSWRWSRCA